jgi:hypothetical protein
MKKIFTLIAVCAMALTANAQGKYAMEEGEEIAYGTQPAKDKRVPNCKMYFGDNNFEGGTDFKAAAADAQVDGYTAYTQGNGINGNKDGGTLYIFMPTIDGSITVAVVLNADKAFHISEDGTDMAGYEGIKVTEKYYGTYSFNVKAGKTYKVWCDGSKLGFYGFEFSDQPTSVKGIKNIVENNGVRYNLAGQKVGADFKGIAIVNGKKVVLK